MNVKSQTELDIGGRETCKYFLLTLSNSIGLAQLEQEFLSELKPHFLVNLIHFYVCNKFTLHGMRDEFLLGDNTIPININNVNYVLKDHIK